MKEPRQRPTTEDTVGVGGPENQNSPASDGAGVRPEARPSTFVVHGRLAPRDRCVHLNAPRLMQLAPGYGMTVTLDSLAVHHIGVPTDFPALLARIRHLVDAYLAAHTFYSPRHDALTWNLAGWVEMQEAVAPRTIVGLVDPTVDHSAAPEGHEDNEPLHRADGLMPLVNASPHLRRALRDFRSIWTTEGSDGAFYAFRSIEVIRQHYEPSDKVSGWKKMNAALGTTQAQIKPLTDIAAAVRHGQDVWLGPKEWLEYTEIAFTVLSRFIDVERSAIRAGRRLQPLPTGVEAAQPSAVAALGTGDAGHQ